MLPHSQVVEDGVELGTVANKAAGRIESRSCPHIVPSHEETSLVWGHLPRQALKCRRFTGTCDAKKSETLAKVKRETEIVDCVLPKNELLRQLADG